MQKSFIAQLLKKNTTKSSKSVGSGIGTGTGNQDNNTSIFRPVNLQQVIGREQQKQVLEVMIASVRKKLSQGQKAALDHILFYGPPGLGKTTFARVLASELGTNIIITSGVVLTKPIDVVSILTNLGPGDIVFIDEIHRLRKNLQEILYSAMEDFAIDVMMGDGMGSQSVRVNLEPFTLIGATTNIGLLSGPLRDRFGIVQHLDYFSDQELFLILKAAAQKLKIRYEPEALLELARRSRGTGRIAIRLLKRSTEFMEYDNTQILTLEVVKKTMRALHIDKMGLDPVDKKILEVVIKHFNGGPVGIKSIASLLGEDIQTIETVHEPYLVRLGFLQRTQRGRIATDKAYKHLNITRSK